MRMLVLAALLLSGCAHVPAWKRELLAHPALAAGDGSAREAFDAHVAEAREAALEPGRSGGGGCGCN